MRGVRLVVLLLALAGCDEMSQQPRYDSAEPSELFADGKSLQSPPEGTIARDAVAAGELLARRPEMTAALLERGRERYGIYCTPCHGAAGYGNGTVVQRGFPAPPSLHQPRLRDAPSAHFVGVISQGYGVMYPYADRVAPRDRWAIAAYIRALQLSQNAPLALLSSSERAKLPEARP